MDKVYFLLQCYCDNLKKNKEKFDGHNTLPSNNSLSRQDETHTLYEDEDADEDVDEDKGKYKDKDKEMGKDPSAHSDEDFYTKNMSGVPYSLMSQMAFSKKWSCRQ